jgi:uncharacterized protein
MKSKGRATELTVSREDGAIVCDRCRVAASPSSRLRGLLGKRGLEAGEGLLLRPASSIHTWFMRFPIDAVFVDADGTVVRIAGDLRPWRAAGRRGARAVLELPAGECERHGLKPGDRLLFAS